MPDEQEIKAIEDVTEPVECVVTKHFRDNEGREFHPGDTATFLPQELRRWTRKGRIQRVEKHVADRSRLGAVPPSPQSGRERVAIPEVHDNRKKDDGPSIKKPEGPTKAPTEGPSKAPTEGPEKTPQPGPSAEKVHSYGPWFHVVVAGAKVTKDDGSGEPRNFREDDADAFIENLKTEE